MVLPQMARDLALCRFPVFDPSLAAPHVFGRLDLVALEASVGRPLSAQMHSLGYRAVSCRVLELPYSRCYAQFPGCFLQRSSVDSGLGGRASLSASLLGPVPLRSDRLAVVDDLGSGS